MNLTKYLTPKVNAVIAALVYGSWAAFANYEHGLFAWSKAAIIQALYAFASTLSVSVLAQKIYEYFKGTWRALAFGFFGSFALMITIPFTIHWIAMTPDIIETIAPGPIIGSFYLMGFLWNLHRAGTSA